ncbi:MAG: hypothetical protein WCJ58_08190, partial [bacterium]
MKKHFEELVAGLIFLMVACLCLIYMIFAANTESRPPIAKVTKLIEIQNDGGFYYQLAEVKLKDQDATVTIRITLSEPKLEKINIGDQIYLSQTNTTQGEVYSFAGFRRIVNLQWIILIFLVLLLIMLGRAGIKYVIAALLLAMMIFSGTFTFLVLHYNVYLVVFSMLGIIAFSSILFYV